jgi:hypothetical protein
LAENEGSAADESELAQEPAAGPEPEPEPAGDAEGGGEPGPAGESESEPAADAEPSSAGSDSEEGFSVEGLMAALNQVKVSELLLSTVSTLASIAYGKLEARDLGEAKAAIDAVGALVPLLTGEIDAGMLRDFEQALANLRLAYADAVSRGE